MEMGMKDVIKKVNQNEYKIKITDEKKKKIENKDTIKKENQRE
ncbi:hypothetical protein [Bacillus anthracis]